MKKSYEIMLGYFYLFFQQWEVDTNTSIEEKKSLPSSSPLDNSCLIATASSSLQKPDTESNQTQSHKVDSAYISCGSTISQSMYIVESQNDNLKQRYDSQISEIQIKTSDSSMLKSTGLVRSALSSSPVLNQTSSLPSLLDVKSTNVYSSSKSLHSEEDNFADNRLATTLSDCDLNLGFDAQNKSMSKSLPSSFIKNIDDSNSNRTQLPVTNESILKSSIIQIEDSKILSDFKNTQTIATQTNIKKLKVKEDKIASRTEIVEIPSSLSSDPSLPSSPIRERKRKISESGTDNENLDDVIAGLKKLAERDSDFNNDDLLDDSICLREERYSLSKIKKCDDDDLESLASIDTDMAPASETSRDFECTYSDLESISESVSSRGDQLFSPSVHSDGSKSDYQSSDMKSYKVQVNTEGHVKSMSLLATEIDEATLISKLENEPSSHSLNSKQKIIGKENPSHDYEKLPVEKLQAMIAELEDVLSDTQMSDVEDDKKTKTLPESTLKAEECIDVKRIITNPLNSDTKSIETFKTCTENVTTEVIQLSDTECKVLSTSLNESDMKSDENLDILPNVKSDSTSSVLDPCENIIISRENVDIVRRVSVCSAEIVHGVTMFSSCEDHFPHVEEPTLVTVISHGGSRESLNHELVKNSNEPNEKLALNPEMKSIDISNEDDDSKSCKSSSSSIASGNSSFHCQEYTEKERRSTVIEIPNLSVAKARSEEVKEVRQTTKELDIKYIHNL